MRAYQKVSPQRKGDNMVNQALTINPYRITRPYYDTATKAEYRVKTNLITGEEQPQIFKTSSKVWHDCEWNNIPLHIQLKLLRLVK